MKIEYENHYLDDLAVANFARASLDKRHGELHDADVRLINYLAKHNHWVPFGHPEITLHFTVPIFVDRQLVRHTVGFVRSETSRRYVDFEPTFYTPDKLGARAENKKQGAKEDEYVDFLTTYDPETDTQRSFGKVQEILQQKWDNDFQYYKLLLDNDVAPEDARIVLPLAMDTSYYLSGSLFAYFRMYNLRVQKDAQRQTQEIAGMLDEIISPLFPHSWLALKEASNIGKAN